MTPQRTVRERCDLDQLLERHGRTFADEAGIRLDDTPAPLFQLLVLTMLLSVRIGSGVAVAAARELFAGGWRTADAMRSSNWQQRVDALGRAHYVRYDESTARYLAAAAERVADVYHGDLRELAEAADGDVHRLADLLTEFDRIGPVGAAVFCREVQAVWPWVRPYFDRRALDGAAALHLPHQPEALAELVPGDDLARFAAALVRTTIRG